MRAGVFGAFVLTFFALLGFSVGDIQFPRFQPTSALAAAGKADSTPALVARDTIRAIVSADHRDLFKSHWDGSGGALPVYQPFELGSAPGVHEAIGRALSFGSQPPRGFLARAPPIAVG